MTPLQQHILDAALPLIVFEGWTERMLGHAAESVGLPAIDAERAFPGGVRQCLDLWSKQLDAQMEQTLTTEYNLESMKIRERIATSVMVRLRLMQPHKEAVRRSIAYRLLPWHARAIPANVYHTVDSMWRAAGDTSTDFNFYTKRGLLAKVYLSTLLVWLNDDSATMESTEAFLYRRIQDVMQIQKIKGNIGKTLNKWQLNISRSA